MALFEKGGADSIDVAGHKIPIQLIGGIAAVVGVLLVLRARKSGQNVAAVGTPANTGVNPVIDSFSGGSTGSDISGQLSNITQQLTSLGQSGINSPNTSGPTIYGNQPATDMGFYFGAPPTDVPAGKHLAWRYTSDFVSKHSDLPGVNSNLGLGYGPPPGTPGSQYAYSWEWTVV